MKTLKNKSAEKKDFSAAVQEEILPEINEFLVCLDKDIAHLEEVLLRLDAMRTFVIKRDDVSLGELLEGIRSKSEEYQRQEARRELVLAGLAESLGFGLKELTLSGLVSFFEGDVSVEVAKRHERLIGLIVSVRKEYRRTSLLLLECARFNRELLQSILELGKHEGSTYGSDGSAKAALGNGFFDFRF